VGVKLLLTTGTNSSRNVSIYSKCNNVKKINEINTCGDFSPQVRLLI
jgi:hypothetical protein